MIINIRGANGAGKSTLARAIMSMYPTREPCFIAGRRRPYGYVLRRAGGGPDLYIAGHYEIATGGTDTISKPDDVYTSVRQQASNGLDVVFEGIIVQDDTRRCIELSRDYPLLVLALRVPVEECLAGIQVRRDARGDTRPLDPTNTVNRAKRLERTMQKLVEAGVDARWVSRAEALQVCLKTLSLGDVEDAEPEPFQLTGA